MSPVANYAEETRNFNENYASNALTNLTDKMLQATPNSRNGRNQSELTYANDMEAMQPRLS